MNMRFNSHGEEYIVDDYGIHQLNPKPYQYNAAYNATYDTPEYKRGSETLQALRLGFILGAIGPVKSLVDFGCGNGAFCKFAKRHIPEVWAYDIDQTEIEGVQKISELRKADVYTFHDSLEHVPDLSILDYIPAKYIVISLPWCHYGSQGKGWFDNSYIHRKPGEHLHHFEPKTLSELAARYGWEPVQDGNHEDIIRKSTHGLQNILTMAFKRK